ncbi:MAG: hypothetical protein CMH55_07800, partial [Myxococcales bacterium]|nr:hypothetical protein [Myxococcales bacterium]
MILAFTYDSRTDINWSEAAREAEKAGVVSIREVGEERVGPAAAGQVHMRRRSRVCDPDGKELEERAAQDALRPFLQ